MFNIGDSYLNNPKLKRAGVKIEMTREMQREYLRCMNDIEYFAAKYVRVLSLDEGYVKCKLYDYQKEFINLMQKNRFVISMQSRQMGKSMTVAVFMLHQLCFNKDYTIAILANKGEQAQEIMFRVQMMYEELPWFIQPGVKVWNKRRIELGNDCIAFTSATNGSAIRGRSVNLVYLDELAFVDGAEAFFQSTFPVLSSGEETKLIITSTPNGMNFFYKMWNDSVEGNNSFVNLKVLWDRHPKRDKKWFDNTTKNMSPKQVAQEILCQFLGSSDTLLSGTKIGELSFSKPIYENDNLKVYENPKKGAIYVATIDTSEGVGLDYSVITIFDVTKPPYRVVAKWRNNETLPPIFANICLQLLHKYNGALAVVEANNSSGGIVCDYLWYEFEYENMLTTKVDQGENRTSGARRSYPGVKTTKKSKAVGCTALKTLVESDMLLISDYDIISEFSTFILKANGTYSADVGKSDDCVMTLVIFAWLTRQQFFSELVESDVRTAILKKMEEMEQETMLSVFFDDGLNNDSEIINFF